VLPVLGNRATVSQTLVVTGPTFALYLEVRPIIRLAFVVIFSLAFAITLAIAANYKNQDIFAGVAAYVTVMVVFVDSNLSGKG
jgi:hypothetical protein